MNKSLNKKLQSAPQTPGVYFFKNSRGKILYVGKATNLRSRLRSYTGRGWKEDMLSEAKNVSWIELASDIAALIEESVAIKKYKPKYNILLRDDKNYFFVAFTKEPFPRIYLTHQPTKNKNSDFIGAFTDGSHIKRVIRLLRRPFPYCTCSSNKKHSRKCVNAQIGKCTGYCCINNKPLKKQIADYKRNIASIKKILNGKIKQLEQEFLKQMKVYAKKQQYEKAGLLRDQQTSLNRILQHSPYLQRDIASDRARSLELLQQLLKLKKPPLRIEGYDISHHQGSTSVASMVVFENGIPNKNEYRKFIMRSVEGINDPAMMKETLSRRLKHSEWTPPDLIIIDGGKGQLNAAHSISKPIPTVSIAKREEELYVPGKKHPFELKKLPPPLLELITSVRDESHRFAISFHRKRRRRLVIQD